MARLFASYRTHARDKKDPDQHSPVARMFAVYRGGATFRRVISLPEAARTRVSDVTVEETASASNAEPLDCCSAGFLLIETVDEKFDLFFSLLCHILLLSSFFSPGPFSSAHIYAYL